ncbi:MAG: translocation and assembly module TamB [Desulforhopalus sp.]|jgi:translocation and assembly module TamB
MKLRNVFFGFFLVLFLLVAAVTGTKSGLVFIQKNVNSMSGGAVSIGSVEGRLITKSTLYDIHLEIPGADIDIKKFDWSWLPMSLMRGTLDVILCKTTQLVIQLRQGEEIAEKKSDSSGLPFFLPFRRLLAQEFAIDGLDVKTEDGELIFQLFTLTTSLEYQNDLIVVNNFSADGPEIGLAFHGNAELQNDHRIDMIGSWRLVEYGFHPSKGTFSLDGPIDSIGVNVSLNDPGEIHVVGVVKNLLDAATWTANVDAKNINLETWILNCPEIILSTVHADMSGDFGHYRGLVVADGFWGVAGNLQFRSDIDGDGVGIDFSSLRIDRNESSAVATNASISWAELFSWEADLDFNSFAINMFFPDFKGSISSEFHSVGDVTEEGLEANLKLKTMDGRVADYIWSAEGNIDLTDERIFSRDLRIQSDSVGGLALVRDAELSWVDKLSWKAEVDLEHFDPGFLHPMAVGDISGNIKSNLEWDGDLPTGGISFSQLSGELRGLPLSGGGEISIDNSSLSTTGLLLSLGNSQLHINGKVEDTLGLKFSFDSPDLSEISDTLLGEFNLKGHVSGAKDSPTIDVAFDGNNLHAANIKLKTVHGHLQADFGTDGLIDGGLLMEEGVIAGVSLSGVNVAVSGTTLAHKLTSEMKGPDGELNFTLAGKYEKGWLGNLSGLFLKTTKFGDWTQLDSAPIELSTENKSLEGFCITNLMAGSDNSTCLSAKVSGEDANWSIDADMASFNMEALHEMALGLPPIKGVLGASVEANGDRKGITQASAHVTAPEVETLLSVTDSDFVSLQLKDSIFTAELEDQNLDLNLSFKATKGGTLDLSGQVHGIGQFDTPLATNTIVGELTLDKYYLNSLAAFTGYGVEPTGWVSSSFGIGGTLGKPEVYGELAIQEGGLELAYQGITLENVVVVVNSRDTSAVVRAGATSDGGHLDIGGVVAYGTEGVEASLHLAGENFLLVNLPEYSLRVTPDAEMKINKNRGQIKGRIIVPSGLIAPEELSGVVKVSEDVVFLGKEQVHAKNGYPFFLDLDVELGDGVKIDGYGLEGRLAGGFNVKITPDDFITGNGELDLLDSTFSFYGRSLDIARGRILFTGGPIDNPGMDIRAQKVISAETARDDEYTVGVDINGLVQDLQYHLFSDPYMDDTDILSQMVVGHSFASLSEEEGSLLQAAAMTLGLQGSSKLMEGIGSLLLIDDLHLEGSTKKEEVSLVVGKRITEDLYIGYDMNMFSRLGQFRVRYDLSRGFYVETRSSSESTGADIIYTFKR